MSIAAIREAIRTGQDLDTVLAQVMDSLVELTDAERACIILVEGPQLEPLLAVGLDEATVRSSQGFLTSRSAILQVVESRATVTTHDAIQDSLLSTAESVRKLRLRSIIGIPMLVRDRVIGVLYADNRKVGVFGKEQVASLEALAGLAAQAIESAHRADGRS